MDGHKLPQLARSIIQGRLEGREPDLTTLLAQEPDLALKGAVFVTLTQAGELRGCIGSLVAYRSLGEDLIANAKAAAFDDPRFSPLGRQELDYTDIEVSVLSEPLPCDYENWDELRSKIQPGEDGVILRMQGQQATFLPQVWEQLPDFDHFFSHLAQKAGIYDDIFSLHPEIETYRVEEYKE